MTKTTRIYRCVCHGLPAIQHRSPGRDIKDAKANLSLGSWSCPIAHKACEVRVEVKVGDEPATHGRKSDSVSVVPEDGLATHHQEAHQELL